MNSYEKLLARVRELNRHFFQCEMGAYHDRCDSVSDSTRQNYEGQSDAFKQAKESVEKILEDFESVPNLPRLLTGARVEVCGVGRRISEIYQASDNGLTWCIRFCDEVVK